MLRVPCGGPFHSAQSLTSKEDLFFPASGASNEFNFLSFVFHSGPLPLYNQRLLAPELMIREKHLHREEECLFFRSTLYQTLSLPLICCREKQEFLTSRVCESQHVFFLQPGPFSFVSSLNRGARRNLTCKADSTTSSLACIPV